MYRGRHLRGFKIPGGGYYVPGVGYYAPLYADITTRYIGQLASGVNATGYNLTMSGGQPATGKVQTIWIADTVGSGGSAPDPSSVSGNGLTYTRLTAVSFASGTIGVRLSMWYAMGTTTGTGVITVSYPSTVTSCVAVAAELNGVSASGINGINAFGNVAGSTNGGASHAAGAFTTSLTYLGGSANRPMVAVSDMVAGIDWSSLSGWSGIDNRFQSSPANNIAVFWRSDLADTTVGATHATASNVGLIAIELVAATVAGAGKFIPEATFPSPMRGLGSGLSMHARRRVYSLGALRV